MADASPQLSPRSPPEAPSDNPPLAALLQAIAQAPDDGAEARRVFHGRGGLHPGLEHLSLDVFPPAWLLTAHAPLGEAALARIGEALAARQAQWAGWAPERPLTWVYQQRDATRAQNRLMAGVLPEPHLAQEAGLRCHLHLLRGLNHGFFLDMAEGRRWVRRWAAQQPGGRVLNLFAYTGAFSLAALQGGAASVVNVDMADGALAQAKRNHALNGFSAGASFLPHDVFTSWGRLGRGGPYELVVMDPPSYQKGSFVAEKDYARLLRRLPGLLAPGGHALLCLNTPKLGPNFLLSLAQAEAPGLQFVERLPNPPAFADVDEARALKVLVFRLPG